MAHVSVTYNHPRVMASTYRGSGAHTGQGRAGVEGKRVRRGRDLMNESGDCRGSQTTQQNGKTVRGRLAVTRRQLLSPPAQRAAE